MQKLSQENKEKTKKKKMGKKSNEKLWFANQTTMITYNKKNMVKRKARGKVNSFENLEQ